MTKLVHIDFVLDGLRGRESFLVDDVVYACPALMALRILEERLIADAGVRTFECGCCINDERLSVVGSLVSP